MKSTGNIEISFDNPNNYLQTIKESHHSIPSSEKSFQKETNINKDQSMVDFHIEDADDLFEDSSDEEEDEEEEEENDQDNSKML